VTGAEAAEGCRIIVEQVDRISKIMRQLLDFARRRPPDRGRCQLVGLIGQTLSLLGPMAQKRKVELVLGHSDSSIAAEVDAGQIQQALTNLLVNGIQATEGSGQVTVSVERKEVTPPPGVEGPAGAYASMTVQDQGKGIPADLVPRVFEPFFTTKDVGEGTGLGLSVAYGIARDHGGWIAVESTPGRGSQFELLVPLYRPLESAS
jgi:signal transduction histidine kinase